MKWLLLVILLLLGIGTILFTSAVEFNAAQELQGHRMGNLVAGMTCLVVFLVLAVGVGLFINR